MSDDQSICYGSKVITHNNCTHIGGEPGDEAVYPIQNMCTYTYWMCIPSYLCIYLFNICSCLENIPLLLNTEQCVWLVPVVGPYPQCTYQLSDCQGIVCTTVYGYVEKVTLSLDNLCADPLSVELTAVTSDGVWFQKTFTESTTQFDYGFFTMQRSDTQLNFSVSILAVSTIILYIHMYTHVCIWYDDTCMCMHNESGMYIVQPYICVHGNTCV